MRSLRNYFRVAMFTGVVLLLFAGCLYLWAITAVEMRFLQCDASFQLDSVESFCRQPAILAYAATFVFIGSVASFGVALFLRIRGKEIS